jgi:hypothetical protein
MPTLAQTFTRFCLGDCLLVFAVWLAYLELDWMLVASFICPEGQNASLELDGML